MTGIDAVRRIREKAKAERQVIPECHSARAEAAKERDNARRRERYRNDPDYRARLVAASKAQYKEDPDYREYLRAAQERRRQDQAFISRDSASRRAAYARKKAEIAALKRTGDE